MGLTTLRGDEHLRTGRGYADILRAEWAEHEAGAMRQRMEALPAIRLQRGDNLLSPIPQDYDEYSKDWFVNRAHDAEMDRRDRERAARANVHAADALRRAATIQQQQVAQEYITCDKADCDEKEYSGFFGWFMGERSKKKPEPETEKKVTRIILKL